MNGALHHVLNEFDVLSLDLLKPPQVLIRLLNIALLLRLSEELHLQVWCLADSLLHEFVDRTRAFGLLRSGLLGTVVSWFGRLVSLRNLNGGVEHDLVFECLRLDCVQLLLLWLS